MSVKQPDQRDALADRMLSAADRAGMTQDDPMRPLIEVMAEGVRQTRALSPEAEQAAVTRIAHATAAVAERVMLRRAHAVDRRTALIGAGALVVVLGLGAVLGHVHGASQPVATPAGPMTRQAAEVLALNDLGAALAMCQGDRLWRDRLTGAMACSVPLRLERAPVPGR